MKDGNDINSDLDSDSDNNGDDDNGSGEYIRASRFITQYAKERKEMDQVESKCCASKEEKETFKDVKSGETIQKEKEPRIHILLPASKKEVDILKLGQYKRIEIQSKY